MATSPNYAWAEPDNSSLVKNGAQDIRALGDAIDTSVWNVGYGQAGKNKIINGAFNNWQRGTTATVTGNASPTLLADRFFCFLNGNGTGTQSQQTFTAGAAPVAGYESQYFHRLAIGTLGTTTTAQVGQKIEDVRTFAGNTITFSFYAKADSARSFSFFITQNFGSGGSADVTTNGSSFSVTTSFTRFTGSVTLPSISGKTIGSSSFLNVFVQPTVTAGFSLDTWGWQVEYGSKATPFQTATGTIQGELAACQRYFQKSYDITVNPGTSAANGYAYSNLLSVANNSPYLSNPIKSMRTAPTVTVYGYSGTAGTVSEAATGTDKAANTGQASAIATEGFIVRNGNASTQTFTQGAIYQYTASAEL
jgi:hypothetical protein